MAVAKRSRTLTLPASAARPAVPAGAPVRAVGRVVERRAPLAGTQHVTWASRAKPMMPEWDALAAIWRAYYANVFVWRCVQIRALQLAHPKIPLRVGADPTKPADHDERSPLLALLDANPAASRRQLLVEASAQFDVTGRFAWEVELDRRDRPVMLWPLIPAYLDPIPTTDELVERPGQAPGAVAVQGALPPALPSNGFLPAARPGPVDWWAGFRYRVVSDEGAWRDLLPKQVCYAWRPSKHDWRQPESLLQAQRLNVSVSVMLDRYNYAFLQNDARPASVVVVQAFAESGEFEAFKQDLQGRFGGPDNAGRQLVVEAEPDEDGSSSDARSWIDVKTLGLSQKDAQALEIYEQELRAICIGCGVPLSVLGDASGRTYSNAGDEHRNFWEMAMVPHFADIADHLTRRFKPLIGDNVVFFDTSKVPALRDPPRFSVPVLADLVGTVVTVNEARTEVGLPPTGRPEDDELNPRPEPASQAEAEPEEQQEQGQEGVEAEPEEALALPPTPTPAVAAGNERQPSPGALEGRADPDYSDGVMVALYPHPVIARGLAVPGGPPPEDLHVTLAYLGKVDELGAADPGRVGKLRTVVAGWAAGVRPIRWSFSGVGRFSAADPPCTVALVDAPSLPGARQRLVELLGQAGFTVARDHGFTAHMTLTYEPGGPGLDADLPGDEMVFYEVALVVGTVRLDLPLSGVRDERARHNGQGSPEGPEGPEPTGRSLPAVPESAEVAGQRQTANRETRFAERRVADWERVDAQLGPLERLLHRQLTVFFETQEQATLSRLTDRRGRQLLRDARTAATETRAPVDPGRIFDLTFWVGRLAELVRGSLEAVMTVGATRVADTAAEAAGGVLPARTGGVFDLDTPGVQEILRARSATLSRQVNTTTFRQITQALVAGIAAGESVEALARRVRTVFAEASANRAELIARTATHSAYMEAGEVAAARLPAGLVVAREWLATPDHRTRHDHRQVDGQLAAMGMPFHVGDPPVRMRFPGDPSAPPEQVIRCRCSLAYRTAKQIEGRQVGGPHVPLGRALAGLGWVADGHVTPAGLARVLQEVVA